MRRSTSEAIFLSHTDEPILSFQRNAFYPLKEERKLLDPKRNAGKAIDLLYHEVGSSLASCRVVFGGKLDIE